MMFWRKWRTKKFNLKYEPKSIEETYEHMEQAYFNGVITEEEFNYYSEQIYQDQIEEREMMKSGR